MAGDATSAGVLIERDADAAIFSPDHAAISLKPIAGYEESELVGDVKGSCRLKARADRREILNDAIDLTRPHCNGSGFEQTTTRDCPMFHR